MSDGVLSQEEINALLSGGVPDASEETSSNDSGGLTSEEMDTIGEIANISMGTAATTLFSLVNKKVEISTPVVTVSSWEDIVDAYEKPCVLVRIAYTKGLDGSNVLVLKENDVKVITDLMMGGEGNSTDEEVGEIHLSAISEAMNQMMGSSATSLSSMLDHMIDISPPSSDLIDLAESVDGSDIADFLHEDFVRITFKLLIGDLVDSEIMQLYPISLAKEMCNNIMNNMESDSASTVEESAPAASAPEPEPAPAPAPAPMPEPAAAAPQGQPYMQPPPVQYAQPYPQPQVNVQSAQFQPFTGSYQPPYQPENIDLIMDVPLEVTVELGRTHKSIQDILDFAPGTIIELNKIAGEPIDVLVNGKYVAKGEVVVIEESFGIRITEIMK
ncbi:MAG: flagellar motor switch phosphatase FliY [Lachnospiraceae bacterium]|jgi:flagellar motor switch protein FliN/FliY|nr:flagellar motor switch phosphatase FliY [Lachnospiraceae bacterium]MCR5355679.1 flagellar motor switch phosphatase FliY [Lachnospiraceae bacterium]